MKCYVDKDGNFHAGQDKILSNCLEVLHNLQKFEGSEPNSINTEFPDLPPLTES